MGAFAVKARILAVVLAFVALAAARASGGDLRFSVAGANSLWLTSGGERGHTKDCREPACDDSDWNRGNLDNSLGLWVGAEKRVSGRDRLGLDAALESAVYYTEYDLSQQQFVLVDVLAMAGPRLRVGGVDLLLRGGAGVSFTGDGRGGMALAAEAGCELPVLEQSDLRLSLRYTDHAGPRSFGVGLNLVTRDTRRENPHRWTLGWAAGIGRPGGIIGDHRELGAAPFWDLALYRHLAGGKSRLGVELGLTAYESNARTALHGVTGNQRSKDVPAVALLWERRLQGVSLAWLVGGGVRVASWNDGWSLLLDDDGQPLKGGVEAGLQHADAAPAQPGPDVSQEEVNPRGSAFSATRAPQLQRPHWGFFMKA